MRKPDFERNTLRILKKQRSERPVLFELFLSNGYYKRLAGRKMIPNDPLDEMRVAIRAMANAGYDYATVSASSFDFVHPDFQQKQSISLNHPAAIYDWESFERYEWRDPQSYDLSRLEKISPDLPEGMKLLVWAPGGVLESLIMLVGYENLCMMLYDDPDLVKAVTDEIGRALIRYYEPAIQADTVGFISYNDDWGFNSQTLISPADLRKYVFPWAKQIVGMCHAYNKPCILHSCGYYNDIIEDIIEDMKFDGRHSYEDKICPVEDAYRQFNGRIAVMGGIDMDFMTRGTPEDIYRRAKSLLLQTELHGGYMLGTGNSVPDSIPFENYCAMTRAALEDYF